MMLESLVRSSPVDLLPGAVQFALEFPEREKDLVTGYCPCFGVEQISKEQRIYANKLEKTHYSSAGKVSRKSGANNVNDIGESFIWCRVFWFHLVAVL
mmetsp:Transcript_11346/g.17456  ORF Transcript_11346/g.17456 Transcript_11346/m.17456 type:complete len:98 (-) Transcript_11346:265-558(-)